MNVDVGRDDGCGRHLYLRGRRLWLCGDGFHRRFDSLILAPAGINVDKPHTRTSISIRRCYILHVLNASKNATLQSVIRTTYIPIVVFFLGAIPLGFLDGLPHPILDHRLKRVHSGKETIFRTAFCGQIPSFTRLFSTLFIIGQFSQFDVISLLAAITSSIFLWKI